MKPKEKQETSKPTKTTKETAATSPKASESAKSPTASPSNDFGGEDPYEDMDDVTKACFDVRP